MDSVESTGFWDALEGRVPTLRDYFAAQAMTALVNTQLALSDELAKQKRSDTPLETFICALAYTYADAMIAERER